MLKEVRGSRLQYGHCKWAVQLAWKYWWA